MNISTYSYTVPITEIAKKLHVKLICMSLVKALVQSPSYNNLATWQRQLKCNGVNSVHFKAENLNLDRV